MDQSHETAISRSAVQHILAETGMLMELNGENRYKARSYTQAARILKRLDRDLAQAVEDGTLNRLPGIGPAMSAAVRKLLHTGELPLHRELTARFPPGLLEVMALPGMGAEKTRRLHDTLGIHSLDMLEQACHDNRVAAVPGFGLAAQARVLREIEIRRSGQGKWLLPEAIGTCLPFLESLPNRRKPQWAGKVRRRVPVVGQVDLLAPEEERDTLTHAAQQAAAGRTAGVEGSVAGGSDLAFTINTIPVRIHFHLGGDDRGVRLLWETGAPAHCEALSAVAAERDFRLDPTGLYDREGSRVPCPDEATLYEQLGLPFIPPEIREGDGEVEAARTNTLRRLLEPGDLAGLMHVHSDWSDGTTGLENLAQRAQEMGFHYIGICDHSQSAFYAGGMKEEAVRRQWQAIDELNSRLDGFRLLKGIECDILADGSLDYPDELLQQFDFVVASIHTHFKMEREKMTRRVLTALHHPYVDVLAHPTGRLLLHRAGYEIDLAAVIATCAETRVAIELNANPHRLDLDSAWCRVARQQGVPLSIGVDAHSTGEMNHVYDGIGAARRGWLEARDVVNCMNADELLASFRESRSRRAQQARQGCQSRQTNGAQVSQPAHSAQGDHAGVKGRGRRVH